MKINKNKIILLLLILASTFVWLYNNRRIDPSKEAIKEVQQEIVSENIEEIPEEEPEEEEIEEPEEIVEEKVIERLEEIVSLKEINSDVSGILTLPGTHIDYPVLKAEDNDFYLYRDINKVKNKNGSIFLDYENNLDEDNENLIIYGHNMKNTNMFSDLMNFKDENYFNEHEEIFLYLENETKRFKIIGALVLDLTNKENFFQFNSFIQANEYMNSRDYVEELKKRAMHFRDEEILPDDKLITLSTCTYETDDSRYLVIGVER